MARKKAGKMRGRRAQQQEQQQQLAFSDGGWGGRRPGAGRRPKGEKAGVPHKVRARMNKRTPMHVAARLRGGLPSLRRSRVFRLLRHCFLMGCDRQGFRLVQFSVQSNHLHLICEAVTQERMVRGLQGLFVRIAKALNKLWGRRGSVFADRYHDHVLGTPREVRNALCYVLNNARKHGCRLAGLLDEFASGWWFDGWKETLAVSGMEEGSAPVTLAGSATERSRWRRCRGGGAVQDGDTGQDTKLVHVRRQGTALVLG